MKKGSIKNNKEIRKSRDFLKEIESRNPDQLYGKNLAISDINILTQAIKKKPDLEKKILLAIETKRFDLSKFIENLKTEKKTFVRIKRRRNTFNNEEITKLTDIFEKKGFKKHQIVFCINAVSQRYSKAETLIFLKNTLKIIDMIPEKYRADFIDRIIFESSQIEKNYEKRPFNLIFENIIQQKNNMPRAIAVMKKLLRKHL